MGLWESDLEAARRRPLPIWVACSLAAFASDRHHQTANITVCRVVDFVQQPAQENQASRVFCHALSSGRPINYCLLVTARAESPTHAWPGANGEGLRGGSVPSKNKPLIGLELIGFPRRILLGARIYKQG